MGEREDLLLDIQISICSLSIICSGLIIFFYRYLNQKKKSFTFTVLFNIALTDLLLWGVRLAESIHGKITGRTLTEWPGMCETFAYLQIALALSNFCWVGIMSFCIYKTLVHRRESLDHLERRFYAFSYMTPLLFSFVPVASRSYGPTDGIICAITGDSDNLPHSIIRLIVFYVPLLITIVYSFWVIARVWKVLETAIPTETNDRESIKRKKSIIRIRKQLRYYPLALVICYFFPLVHRLISTINEEEGNKLYLLILHYLSEPLQGFCNAVVYGTSNRDVRHKLKRWFCCCFKRRKINFEAANNRFLSETTINSKFEESQGISQTLTTREEAFKINL